MTARIEQALRKDLAEYGLDTSGYAALIEPVYEHQPTLVRTAIFYRPDGRSVIIDSIYTDRGGWPVQWAEPRMTSWSPALIRQFDESRAKLAS